MERPKSYRVAVRRKIPYLTNFFLLISGILFLVILIYEILFSPLKHAGLEAKSVVFYWLVPAFWKVVLIISLIGFFATSVIYGTLRYYKPACLSFFGDEIVISGKTIKESIPLDSIRKIYCNEPVTFDGKSKQVLHLTIEHKKRKAVAIKLKAQDQTDDFIDELIRQRKFDISFYNFSFNPTHDGES